MVKSLKFRIMLPGDLMVQFETVNILKMYLCFKLILIFCGREPIER